MNRVYIETNQFNNDQEWQQSIQALKNLGGQVYENECEPEFDWRHWTFLGIDRDGGIIHENDDFVYGCELVTFDKLIEMGNRDTNWDGKSWPPVGAKVIYQNKQGQITHITTKGAALVELQDGEDFLVAGHEIEPLITEISNERALKALQHLENAVNGPLMDDCGNRDEGGIDFMPRRGFIYGEVRKAYNILKGVDV